MQASESRIQCRAEDGTIYEVMTITSNEDHAAAAIFEGSLQEQDRWREIARVYRCQLNAAHLETLRLGEVYAQRPLILVMGPDGAVCEALPPARGGKTEISSDDCRIFVKFPTQEPMNDR